MERKRVKIVILKPTNSFTLAPNFNFFKVQKNFMFKRMEKNKKSFLPRTLLGQFFFGNLCLRNIFKRSGKWPKKGAKTANTGCSNLFEIPTLCSPILQGRSPTFCRYINPTFPLDNRLFKKLQNLAVHLYRKRL